MSRQTSRINTKDTKSPRYRSVSVNDPKKVTLRSFSKSRLEVAHPELNMQHSPSTEVSALLRQNQELRQRLLDESNNYRQRIDTYKKAQQNQATLVSRLQTKILQYKQKCSELETRMHTIKKAPTYSTKSILETSNESSNLPCSLVDSLQHCRNVGHHSSHDDVCRNLDDEKQRCDILLAQNEELRQQLEESNRTNEALTNDLEKLTNDWEILREELYSKENEFKEEEQAFNDFYTNEQNRLLNMWHNVNGVKHAFKDMQGFVKAELNKMEKNFNNTTRDISSSCNGIALSNKEVIKITETLKIQNEKTTNDLKGQIHTLKTQLQNARCDLNERDLHLQDLSHQIKLLQDRCSQADDQATHINILKEDIERLNACITCIAHAVVQDAERSGNGADIAAVQNLHLSSLTPPKSPKRGKVSKEFSESTVAAVQATLQKYQMFVHDLQIKTQSLNDLLKNSQKELNNSDQAKEVLTGKVSKLTEKLDKANSQLSEVFKEREILQTNSENIRIEKNNLEKIRVELNSMIDSLNSENEKMQIKYGKLQKHVDMLEEEKKAMEFEKQTIIKERDMTDMSLRAEEDRGSRLREEVVSLREELNKLYLSRDLLEQQRIESENLITFLEKQKSELEFELEKTTLDKNELQNRLNRISTANDNNLLELKKLKDHNLEVENERDNLRNLVNDQADDISSLKKELLCAEQARLDLESEKLSLSEKQKLILMEKEKIEQDLAHVSRERADLHNQLTSLNCKKESISEELMRTRQKLEQANETNNRLNNKIEDLLKQKEEQEIIIETNEKEIQKCQEVIASLRTEKNSLEAILFDTNTTLEATEEKRNQLETELQNLLIKEESLKNHVAKLNKELEHSNKKFHDIKSQLSNELQMKEQDLMQKLSKLKDQSDENLRKLHEEKESLKNALEKRMQQALQALKLNKDEEITQLREKIEEIHSHLENLSQEHEDALVKCENDKQQALLFAHREKQAIIEKLDALSRQLKIESETSDRMRRESSTKAEKDRNLINSLRDEITGHKIKWEEIKTRLEEDINKLEIEIASLKEERDSACRQVDEMKVEIRLKEDKVENLNNQLQDAKRKIKEAESMLSGLRKDLTDSRRALVDSNIERDKYSESNKDLRDHIKQVESSKREQARTIEEALQKISSIEESRNGLENEKNRLTCLLKDAENKLTLTVQELNSLKNNMQKMQIEGNQKQITEKELNARLTNEIEERERSQQELNQTKKQLEELNASLCTTRQELGRARCHTNQEEHRWHSREQDLQARLEDFRGREKRLEDQKHNLEVCLADATQQIQELKARTNCAENKVHVLDEQLSNTETLKKIIENKLSSIAHTLRRIAGIQFDGSLNPHFRLLSPSRRYSPVRGGSCPQEYDSRCVSNDGPVDVDPDLIRKGIRTLMHQVAQIEREKDDYKSQMCLSKKQLQEALDQQSKCDSKVSKLQHLLRNCQEEKSKIECQLATKITSLNALEQIFKQKSDEIVMLEEKITSLEIQIGSEADEKQECEERFEKCRQHGSRLESEKCHLQDDLSRAETKISKLDIQRVALEGDINRLQMALAERDNLNRTLQERLDNINRTLTQLEDRCSSLKTTIEQQTDRLQKAAVTETELRGEINSLHKERTEHSLTSQANQDRIKALQKVLTNCETEKKIFSERLDAAQNTITDLRRNQQAQQDAVQRLQEQIANLEVQKSTVESQLRITKWQHDTDLSNPGQAVESDLSRQLLESHREKIELKGKLDALKAKIKQFENERQSKFSGHVQFDQSEKNIYCENFDTDSNRMETESYISRAGNVYNCRLDHSLIEQENRDLRIKVRRLETLLAEKESEIARIKARLADNPKCSGLDSAHYRNAKVEAEKMLDAREQAYRQQVLRLENQISMLREQLAHEAKRRQQYILRSSRANREMQHLRNTLGDSLRQVSQDPLDTSILETETKRLDTAMSLSLPPTTCHDYNRSISPRK